MVCFRACLHGGGRPQVCEVTSIGNLRRWDNLPVHIISNFILIMYPGRVTLPAWVTICHVKVSRWGNLPSQGHIHVTKKSNEQNNSKTRVC